jgi:RNA polymerase sigma factor (sigma-70 family)
MAVTPPPDSTARQQEDSLVLRRALELLPDPYRQVICWRNRDRLPFEAIGQLLGVPADDVRALWVRALELLARQLRSCP